MKPCRLVLEYDMAEDDRGQYAVVQATCPVHKWSSDLLRSEDAAREAYDEHVTASTCAMAGCNAQPTHRVTARDTAGELYTADVCDDGAEHHRKVRQGTNAFRTVQVSQADLTIVSITSLPDPPHFSAETRELIKLSYTAAFAQIPTRYDPEPRP